jgi:hypothetical protein
MDGVQVRTRSWDILAWWTLASLAGWATGMAMGTLLTVAGSNLFGLNEDRVLAYATLLAVALACGVAQSVVLRGCLPGAWRWIPATLAGYLLALAVFLAASGARMAIAGPILFGVAGAAIGVPQWLLLRRHFRGIGLWALASAVGFLSFLWLVGNPASSSREFIGVGAILGTLAALPPGVVLAWAVGRPREAIEPKESFT